MQYTQEQVLKMAPDDASAKAGQQLANSTKWVVKLANLKALWGDCQGSGSTPYKTIIDLTNLAFKCSCPSRKFPCKHGLGLMLLYVQQPSVFTEQPTLPQHVSEWLAKRDEKEEAKEQKEQKPADDGAKKKREDAREKKVSGGIEELRSWLSDVVRGGIMNVPQNIYQFSQNITARMVDAQAGGLAGQLRQINKIDFYHDGWQKALIKRLAKIYLITEAYRNKELLPPSIVQELQTLIGWTTSKEEVLQSIPVKDTWTVLSVTITEEDNLKTERIWLFGIKSKRYALLLNFYAGSQLPDHLMVSGMSIDAEVVYFPGVVPLRGLIKSSQPLPSGHLPLDEPGQVIIVYEKITDTLSQSPFVEQVPFILSNIALAYSTTQWWVKDKEQKGLQLTNTPDECWKMLTFTKGKTCNAFGIYENEKIALHSLWSDNKTCFIR